VLKEIRSWNRISVLVGFLGVLAVVRVAQWLADRWSARRPTGRAWLPSLALALPVLLVGLLDAVPARLAPPPLWQERYTAHEAFFQAVAGRLPAGSPVLQVPHIGFPEADDQNPVGPYDQARAYVFAPGLRWTYGWVTGRGESPAARLAALPPAQLVAEARAAGLAGVVLDRVGVPDPDAYEAALVAAAGAAPVRSDDARYVFVTLTGTG
jgi:hypothetical protein